MLQVAYRRRTRMVYKKRIGEFDLTMVPGKLYRPKFGYKVGLIRLGALPGLPIRGDYRTVYETDVLLFLEERPISDAYNGTGPSAKQIKELFFLFEDQIWSITSNVADVLEQVI